MKLNFLKTVFSLANGPDWVTNRLTRELDMKAVWKIRDTDCFLCDGTGLKYDH